MGDIQETPGAHLGLTWETPGRNLGAKYTWETSGRHRETPGAHMEDTWETPGRHLGDTWETPGVFVFVFVFPCHGDKQTSENRATQLIDTGLLTFAIF